MSDRMNPSKLKVAELKLELQSRGLDSKANKTTLVERLREALEAEDLAGDAKAVKEEAEEDEYYEMGFEDVKVNKEEVEDNEYYEMGYEDAPLQDADVKTVLGNGYKTKYETEFVEINDETLDPKEEEEPSSETEDRRGEKRRAHSLSCSPDSKKLRPEVEKVRLEDEPDYDKSAVLLDWSAESAALPVPADEIPAEIPDIRERSRSPTPPPPPHGRSRESSGSSNVSVPVSISSVVPDDKGTKKKIRTKMNCKLSDDEEELMLDFIRDNPMIWNTKMIAYKCKDKKDKMWEDQAEVMDKTTETLKIWFKSLRDAYTRMDKKKSGDGAPDRTEREEWIMSKFAFLKKIIRHRPEPFQSVKATIQQHRGDLDAAETACADMVINTDEMDPTPSFTPSSSRKQSQDQNSAVLETLQKRVAESDTILKNLSTAQQQQQLITARTTFANYVRDSLLTMSKARYKKARSTMNRLLSDLLDEDSDDDIPSAM